MKTARRRGPAGIQWGIHHQDRELAKELGDPCLGVLKARTKRQAEAKASCQGLSGPTGVWAHPLGGS